MLSAGSNIDMTKWISILSAATLDSQNSETTVYNRELMGYIKYYPIAFILQQCDRGLLNQNMLLKRNKYHSIW